MRNILKDPAVRARFLAAYSVCGVVSRAAAAAGVSAGQVYTRRRFEPAFRDECAAAVAGVTVTPRPAGSLTMTPPQRIALLAALAEIGSATAACRRTGVDLDTAQNLRRADPDFAAAWAEARHRAHDRIEDELFEAVLTGFVHTTEKDGSVVTRRGQQANAMFKLLAMRDRHGRRGGRTIELTPAVLAEARTKFDAMQRHAAATGEVPPPPLSTLPPPTLSASSAPLTASPE